MKKSNNFALTQDIAVQEANVFTNGIGWFVPDYTSSVIQQNFLNDHIA